LLLDDKLSDSEGKELFDNIRNNRYDITNSLKDHHRSIVQRIDIDNQDLVLKVPLEKNTRKWIRLMTWFRMGEAHKNLDGMERLWSKEIKTTIPLMAVEKRSTGMVTDSWLVYEYLDGITCHEQPQYYEEVINTLGQMHKKGFLHGDPQIRNFVAVDDDIYVIDSNPKSAWSAFDRAYEWAYLRKSAPGIEKLFGNINNWWLYKVAFWYDIYERRFVKNRRKVKNAIKSLFSSSK